MNWDVTNIEVSHLLLLHLDPIIGIFTLLIICGDKGKTCRKSEVRKVEKELIPGNLPSANVNDSGKGGCWLLDLLSCRNINFSQMVDELET